jgi:hypothetical protein
MGWGTQSCQATLRVTDLGEPSLESQQKEQTTHLGNPSSSLKLRHQGLVDLCLAPRAEVGRQEVVCG